jgi:cytochrome P450
LADILHELMSTVAQSTGGGQAEQGTASNAPAHNPERPHAESVGLSPPRWVPSLFRWHTTRVSLVQAWRYASRAVRATRSHMLFDFVAELPGHDDVISARTPAKLLIVRNADYAHQILVANQDNYAKSAEYDLLAVALGRGLVTNLDDDSWRAHRRLLQPVFGKRHVDGFARPMTDAVAAASERWQRDHPDGKLDIAAEMSGLTLDIIGRTMFGTELTSNAAAQIRDAFARLRRFSGVGVIMGAAYWARMIANVLWRFGPDRHAAQDPRLVIRVLRWATRVLEPDTYRGLVMIESFVERQIAAYHAESAKRQDTLLGLLVESTDPDTGDRFTDAEVRDELMTFLAAVPTTADTLVWTWLLLSRHPEVRERLQTELDAALAGRPPSVEDLQHLPWTRAVVEESMRLYPPVMAVARVAKRDDVLGRIPIEAGATVVVLIHGAHHNPASWSDPEHFDPSRFLPDVPAPSARRATIPFGGGRRMCIAANFARMEIALIVALVSQRFELDLAPQPPLRRENTLFGGPEGSVWMNLRQREAAPASGPKQGHLDPAVAQRKSGSGSSAELRGPRRACRWSTRE